MILEKVSGMDLLEAGKIYFGRFILIVNIQLKKKEKKKLSKMVSYISQEKPYRKSLDSELYNPVLSFFSVFLISMQ